jgi:hypothetical protein
MTKDLVLNTSILLYWKREQELPESLAVGQSANQFSSARNVIVQSGQDPFGKREQPLQRGVGTLAA